MNLSTGAGATNDVDENSSTGAGEAERAGGESDAFTADPALVVRGARRCCLSRLDAEDVTRTAGRGVSLVQIRVARHGGAAFQRQENVAKFQCLDAASVHGADGLGTPQYAVEMLDHWRIRAWGVDLHQHATWFLSRGPRGAGDP